MYEVSSLYWTAFNRQFFEAGSASDPHSTGSVTKSTNIVKIFKCKYTKQMIYEAVL
jgi:hypothetical protein